MSLAKTPKAENADPLRLKAGREAKRKEAARRAGFTRGGYLEWLFNNAKIGQAQYLAGCRVRALFAEREGQARGIDWSLERVDGGRADRDFLNVSTTDAERSLKRLAEGLGPDQAFVLFAVIGLGQSIQTAAGYFAEDGKERLAPSAEKALKDYCGRLIKDALGHAAFHFGFATKAAATARNRRLRLWCDAGLSTILECEQA